jgi:hypothetical protein
MAKEEWMKNKNPLKIKNDQILLKELKNYEESSEECEWNLIQIREFYSLLYQHKPTKNVSNLLWLNLQKNKMDYMNVLGFNKKYQIFSSLGMNIFILGGILIFLGLVIKNPFIMIPGVMAVALGSTMTTIISKYFPDYYKKAMKYYDEHRHKNKRKKKGNFIDDIAKVMYKILEYGHPSALNALGALSLLGVNHLNKIVYSESPNNKELKIFEELKDKIEKQDIIPCFQEKTAKKSEKTTNRFLMEIKDDINKVKDARYLGYEEDLKSLVTLAQDFILETAPRDDNSVINLEGNHMASLYKRLVDLEQQIENRIKRKEYIEDNTSFVIEDLATQLRVDKLDQVDQEQKLKLSLK